MTSERRPAKLADTDFELHAFSALCLIDPLQPEGLEETESERPSLTEDLRRSADLSVLANPFEEASRPIQSSEEDPNDE
eukprot:CAMPEP_0168325416 /NCGR_PEP_ID=MMETSP0213-20121227/4679_1 /TAXON_ID=151035 /ORGANISM="Euplotes harpa, Strain FSP1.4" /LENGTH=78 /DNA_ID=CAMNT_0008327905 /DNA_START=22 /DNA_END=256 /DNA_ORIENTATION=+